MNWASSSGISGTPDEKISIGVQSPRLTPRPRALESQNSQRMSQVSRGDLSFLDPSVDHLIDLVEALAQFGVVQNLDRKDLREAGS